MKCINRPPSRFPSVLVSLGRIISVISDCVLATVRAIGLVPAKPVASFIRHRSVHLRPAFRPARTHSGYNGMERRKSAGEFLARLTVPVSAIPANYANPSRPGSAIHGPTRARWTRSQAFEKFSHWTRRTALPAMAWPWNWQAEAKSSQLSPSFPLYSATIQTTQPATSWRHKLLPMRDETGSDRAPQSRRSMRKAYR